MVIDTNIFIEFLRAKNKTKTALYKIPDNIPVYISAITLYELLMGATTQNKMNDVRLLTEGLAVLSFNEDVAKEASKIYHRLRRTNKIIE